MRQVLLPGRRHVCSSGFRAKRGMRGWRLLEATLRLLRCGDLQAAPERLSREGDMTKWSVFSLLCSVLLLAACRTTSLTPEQSAGLKEAEQFADEVTAAYGVQGVKILVYEGASFEPYMNWGRYISIAAVDLARGSIRDKIVPPLAFATIGYMPDARTAAAYRRQWIYDRNRRAVEISVKFLGVAKRQAVETNAARIVKLNEDLRRRGVRLPTPCDQLQDLWSHFAMTDPVPACDSAWMLK